MKGSPKDPAALSPAYVHSGFFVLRTPLLPFAEWAEWLDRVRMASPTGTPIGSEAELRLLEQELREWSTDSIVSEGLFLASSTLVSELEANSESRNAAQLARTSRALGNYRARMSGRCTPFGLFAGWTTGRIDSESRLQLPSRSHYLRTTRLDSGLLTRIIDGIFSMREDWDCLVVRPNASIIEVGKRIRFTQVRTKLERVEYFLMSVAIDSSLERLLSVAAGGVTIGALRRSLQTRGDSSTVAAYVKHAVKSQLLVPDLCYSVTGAGPLEDLLGDLERNQCLQAEHRKLSAVKLALGNVDKNGLGVTRDSYLSIANQLGDVATATPPSHMFQVELTKPASGMTLKASIVEELLAAAKALHCLFAKPSDLLTSFRKKFVSRYGDANVPLLEALDEESGIGYGSSGATAILPLLAGVPRTHPGRLSQTIAYSKRARLLQRLLYDLRATGGDEIELTDEHLDECRDRNAPPLPDAFHIGGSIVSLDDISPICARIDHVSGPSGAIMLGRFCHIDKELRQQVEKHLATEATLYDAELCEIVHVPSPRLGNVVARPKLRKYEIPILARSGATTDTQVHLSDLMIAVQGEEVILRSRRLGRRILPRLTSALNTTLPGLGLYRFLAALQWQGVCTPLTWDWEHLAELPYLPRVRYKRVLLTTQRWRLDSKELNTLHADSAPTRFARFQSTRQRLGLPRYVSLIEGDNILPIDCDNIASVENCISTIRKRRSVTLRDLNTGTNGLVVTSPDGEFVNECIIPYVRKASMNATTSVTGPIGDPASGPWQHSHRMTSQQMRNSRQRPPGSQWCYAKIYCGEATTDRILLSNIEPLAMQLATAGLVNGWFFVRYYDEDPHLRVRFWRTGARIAAHTQRRISRVLEGLLTSGTAWRIAYDTYDREVERYGGVLGIDACETMFHADSRAAVQLIREIDAASDERWIRTISGVDSILNDFGMSLDDKLQFAEKRAALIGELSGLSGSLQVVKTKFRTARAMVVDAIMGDHTYDSVLLERSHAMQPAVQILVAHAAAGKLGRALPDIVTSIVHMHVNRMLASLQSQQEAIIYRYLALGYRGLVARRDKTE